MPKILVKILVSFFVMSSVAHAASSAWVGLHLHDFDYEEKSSTRDRSREKGVMPLFEGGYRSVLAAGHAVQLRGQLVYGGATTYTGTDFNTFAAISAQDVHNIYDFEARYEGLMPWGFWFFAGVGWRQWDRFLSYGTGYREIYRWTTASLGARGWAPALQGGPWQIGWEFALRQMLTGTLDVLFSETFTSGVDSGLALGLKTGFRLTIPVESSRSWFWDARPRFEVWYDQSEIGRSNTVFNGTPAINGFITEPASMTRQVGLQLALKRDF